MFQGIRSLLLESEEQECPNCHQKSVSPDTLIPNRFLRSAVTKFRSDGVHRKATPQIPVAASMPVAAPEAEIAVPTAEDDDNEDDSEEPELVLEVGPDDLIYEKPGEEEKPSPQVKSAPSSAPHKTATSTVDNLAMLAQKPPLLAQQQAVLGGNPLGLHGK
jgi:E3 ubiquitin-protein ligase RBBP6